MQTEQNGEGCGGEDRDPGRDGRGQRQCECGCGGGRYPSGAVAKAWSQQRDEGCWGGSVESQHARVGDGLSA